MNASLGDQLPMVPRPPEVVLLIHGIRTFAGWQPMVKRVLEEITNLTVVPINFGYLDPFRFWFPLFTRNTSLNDIRGEIQDVRSKYPDARLSVIAHSFGTYAIIQILKNTPALELHRLVLCGSVIKKRFHWNEVEFRIKTEVVNDYGTRDIWPVLAKCLSWGYGDTGSFGFGRTAVVDRAHNYAHSDFFHETFVREYWKPLFEEDRINTTLWAENAPPSSRWLIWLSISPLQWLITIAILASVLWFCVVPPDADHVKKSEDNVKSLKELVTKLGGKVIVNEKNQEVTVQLDGTKADDVTLRNLKEFRIQVLDLRDTGVTDSGLDYLKKLAGLKIVYLQGTKKVTIWGVETLRRDLPEPVEIQFEQQFIPSEH